ncbi:hypothetical protein ACVWWI_006056 [Bradyrhizobium sp. USDA 3686]|nr:hypothetical protein [Bradyrhizobium canariense]
MSAMNRIFGKIYLLKHRLIPCHQWLTLFMN